MSLFRHLARGVRVLARRSAADADVEEELRQFMDEARSAAIAGGAAPSDAERSARLAFGDVTAIREEVRSHGWEYRIETAAADLRYAARGVRRSPGFALVTVLTLALGIGSTAAIFSAVDPILFEPLPYPQAGRIVSLADRGGQGQPVPVTYGTYVEISRRSRSFAQLAVADAWQPSLIGRDDPERLGGDRVTTGFFRVLGVAPAVGRDFTAADDVRGAPLVAVVSDGFARRHFGSAPSALGRAITLDRDDYTIVGVMPAGFDNVLQPEADVWAPRRYRDRAPFESAEWGHHLRMIGRLVDGVSIEQTRGELDEIGRSPMSAYPRPPWASMAQGIEIRSLQGAVTSDVRPALLAILAAVALVLLVAVVNVTNLLLARGAQRRGELALRTALGAGRGRIVRQLLTESLLLAFCGGALGLALASAGVRLLVAVAPAGLPRAGAVTMDTRVFAFAAGLTLLTGILVGLYPALRSTRRDERLQSGSRVAGGHAVRRVLVIAEVGLALALLVGTGLMLRSLTRLMAIAPGFDPDNLLTMEVDAAGRNYSDDGPRYQFFVQALEAVRRLPGVTSAAFSSQLPLGGQPAEGYGIHFEAQGSQDPNGDLDGLRYTVTPGWFAAMRIPLVSGRLLDDRDRTGTEEAIVISESLARQAFEGKDPIGQRLRIGPEISAGRPWDVVVGVVKDVKQTSLAVDEGRAFYAVMGQWPWVDTVQTLVVRTSHDPAALAPSVKRAIWSVDRNLPIARVATMASLVERSEAQRRFVLTVFAAFGLAALALAAIGIYGMVSGGVTERLTEIGVRAALGASRGAILRMILRQGLLLAAAGIALGVGGAAVLSGLLRTLVYGISRADAATYITASAAVLVIAALASIVPAMRAARVDPAATLRA